MTSRQIKQRLMVASVAMLLVGIGALLWAMWTPVAVPDAPAASSLPSSLAAEASLDANRKLPSLQSLRALGEVDLRRPLRDPPPPPPPPPVPLSAKLVGTVYVPDKPSQSMAMFQLANGSEQWFQAGQAFDDPAGRVTVKRVGDQTVMILYRDAQQELAVGAP